MKTILHICYRIDWEKANQDGEYKNPSLETEGFIHFSNPEQVLGTANLFYSGQDDLVLLVVDPDLLSSELRYDPVEETHFPHLYGPLNLSAVRKVLAFPPDEDGQFSILPGL